MAENRDLALVLRLVADDFKKELQNSQGALASFNNFIKDWRAQLVAAGTALFAIAKSTANYADELVDMGQRLGTSVEETARLRHATQLADTNLQSLSSTMGFLSKNMLEAARGNKDAQQAFAQLGVTVTTTSGNLKGTTDILLELSDRFRMMPDGPEKLALAMSVMGKSAKDVLPLMNSNMREAFQETKALGLEMSDRAAKAASEFNDQLDKLKGSVVGVGNSVGEVLIPHLTSLSKILTTITSDAGSALRALLNLDKLEAPQVGVVQPEGGGRRLRTVPAPSADIAKQFQTQPFFRTPEQAAAEQERIAKEQERFAKELVRRGQEKERIGKALLEIFLAQNRALDIRNKLMREAAEGASEYFLAFDRAQQREKEDQDEQVRKGQSIVEQTRLEVQLREQAQQRERDGLIRNAQAWIDYDNQVGASTELRMEHQLDLLRANMANQLQITTVEAGNLLNAWTEHESMKAEAILAKTTLTAQERETIELQSLTKLAAINQHYAGDIFQGWALGLQRYVQDTQSAFGFAADLARRTAQMMEQNFRQFFFDAMNNEIKSLEDVLKSFENFAKQMIAQVMAQLATMLVLKGITGGFGGFSLGGLFGGGGGGGGMPGFPSIGVSQFSGGGAVLGSGNRDTVRALLTPGEGVLSRRGMATLDQLNAGIAPAASAAPNITVQIVNSGWQNAPQVNLRRQFKGMVVEIVRTDPDLRQMLGRA